MATSRGKGLDWRLQSLECIPDIPIESLAVPLSQTERGESCRTKGNGDDSFALTDLEATDGEEEYLRLEGTPPDRYEGDRERTIEFLTEFKQFMLTNNRATIVRNPIHRCSYFLSLINGPKVEGWTGKSYHWLDEVESDPSMIPLGMSTWDVLESDFRRTFVDSADRERALDKLMRLKMKEGKVDEFIATFKRLGHRAGIGLDDPLNLMTFARGLPWELAEACIDKESTETFEEWASAARRQQGIWLKKQALKAEYYGTPQSLGSRDRGGFFWRRPGQNNPTKGNPNALRPRLPAPK